MLSLKQLTLSDFPITKETLKPPLQHHSSSLRDVRRIGRKMDRPGRVQLQTCIEQ